MASSKLERMKAAAAGEEVPPLPPEPEPTPEQLGEAVNEFLHRLILSFAQAGVVLMTTYRDVSAPAAQNFYTKTIPDTAEGRAWLQLYGAIEMALQTGFLSEEELLGPPPKEAT